MQQTMRGRTVSTMRALIFLCVFGWAVTAANGMTFNCNGCRGPLEGFNGTTNSSTVPGQNSSITVQKSEPTKASRVNWNGTWIPIDNSLGFPKGPDNQNALNNTKAQNRNVACLGTRPRRRASPHASNWNPLQTGLLFKDDIDENQLNASDTTTNSSTLNATDAVALNASDTTTNSSTTNEGDAQTERSKRDTGKHMPFNIWHKLTGPGFNPEENDSQLNGTDVDPQNGSNNTTSSSTFQVSSTAKPRTRAKPTKPSSFWHPLKGPGFEAEENDSQTNEGDAQTERSK